MLTRLFRGMAWLYVAALIFMTLSSPTLRVETGFPHNLEHLAAFGVSGFLFSIGYRSRRVLILIGGIALVAVLEVLQIWAPDRHARWIDVAMNAAGFCIGLWVSCVVSRSPDLGAIAAD